MINFWELLQSLIITTISGIIINAAWFILIIWAVKTIAKEMPHWIESYYKQKMHYDKIRWAKGEVQ